MDRTSRLYQAYVQILKEELIPAMGCTEPIAIAYAAAKAREVLGRLPERVYIGVSNNIIKNVKSVIVPNTGGMKGIEAAAAAGIVAGRADRALEVIAEVSEEQKAGMRRFLAEVPAHVEAVDNGQIFDILIRLTAGDGSAAVRIAQYHTNIVRIEKDGQVLLDRPLEDAPSACGHEGPAEAGLTDHGLLTIADILDFAGSCDLAANALVSFACAMQVQAFRKVHGYPFASTMCIGNLRSGIEALVTGARLRDGAVLRKAGHYFAVILLFALGAGLGACCTARLGLRAIWLSCAMLCVSLCLMFRREDAAA